MHELHALAKHCAFVLPTCCTAGRCRCGRRAAAASACLVGGGWAAGWPLTWLERSTTSTARAWCTWCAWLGPLLFSFAFNWQQVFTGGQRTCGAVGALMAVHMAASEQTHNEKETLSYRSKTVQSPAPNVLPGCQVQQLPAHCRRVCQAGRLRPGAPAGERSCVYVAP